MWLDEEPSEAEAKMLQDAAISWQVSPEHPVLSDSSKESFFAMDNAFGQVRCALQLLHLFEKGSADKAHPPDWVVMVDDDTMINFPNLQAVLGRFRPDVEHYIGSGSEVSRQDMSFGFMVFGGGGIALSRQLVERLLGSMERTLLATPRGLLWTHDSALARCVDEIGVRRSRAAIVGGFHQLDMSGSARGVLEAHPRLPVVSLHHLFSFKEILPGLSPSEGLVELAAAMQRHPSAFLQQTVCRWKGHTIAIANGATIRLWEEEVLERDLTTIEQTFWTEVTPGCINSREACIREMNSDPWIFGLDTRPQEEEVQHRSLASFTYSEKLTAALGALRNGYTTLRYQRIPAATQKAFSSLTSLTVTQPNFPNRWHEINVPPVTLCCSIPNLPAQNSDLQVTLDLCGAPGFQRTPD